MASPTHHKTLAPPDPSSWSLHNNSGNQTCLWSRVRVQDRLWLLGLDDDDNPAPVCNKVLMRLLDHHRTSHTRTIWIVMVTTVSEKMYDLKGRLACTMAAILTRLERERNLTSGEGIVPVRPELWIVSVMAVSKEMTITEVR